MRARVLFFLGVIVLDAALVHQQLWAMVIGVLAYVIIVLPILRRNNDPNDQR